MSKAPKIKKRHKLYYRNDRTGALMGLDKSSPVLYLSLIKYFTEGSGAEKYVKKNKGVTNVKDIQPIEFVLPHDIASQLGVLTQHPDIVIYYNASWKPLVSLKRPKTTEELKQIL